MRELPEEQQRRLTFQSQAAQVQHELTRIVLQVAELLQVLYVMGAWSSDLEHPTSGAEEAAGLVERWRALEPPAALRMEWSELQEGFEMLVTLLEKVPALRFLADAKLRDAVAELQREFNDRLAALNQAEARLSAREARLRSAHSRG